MQTAWEDVVTRLLRVYYGKLFPTVSDAAQIQKVLTAQFSPANSLEEEIGGSIFQEEKELELRIIKPLVNEHLKIALEEYRVGNDEYVALLHTFAEQKAKRMREVTTTQTAEQIVLEALCLFLKKPQENSENRQRVAKLYEQFILSRTLFYSLQDHMLTEKNFRGRFHVHYNGTSPSRIDLSVAKRTEIPGLVISATSDYEQTGITLYLTHSQGYEELYRGKLPEEL